MADEARRALAVAAAVVVCLAALPMLPVFLVARAITPRGDDEGGYFKW